MGGTLQLRGWSGRSWLAATVAILFSILAIFGTYELEVEADIVDALASPSEDLENYRRFQERFSLGQSDEALLVRADDLADPDTLLALEDLILELQFADGVAEVVSLFSITAEGSSAPLIQTDLELPLRERFDRLLASGPGAQALVSSDRSATLLHVIGSRDTEHGQIAASLPDLTQDLGLLTVRAVGQSAVERKISTDVIKDQIIVTPLAILICVVVGFVILRSFRAILVCTIPAICGVLWFMGLLGLVGRPLDPWLVTLPTLVMVLAFADAIHLFYASREKDMGLDRAIRDVLPAAFLTSLTSALALGSFAIVGADALLGIATWGPIAVFCGFLSVALLFPLLARLLMQDDAMKPRGFSRFLTPTATVLRYPMSTTALAAVLALVLLPAMNSTVPVFSVSEYIPKKSVLGQDLAYMEQQGLGSASLFVEVEDTDGIPGLSEEDGGRIATVAAVILDENQRANDDPPRVPERFQAQDGLSVALPVLMPLGLAPERLGSEVSRLNGALADAGLADVSRLSGQSLLAHEVVPATVSAMRLSFYVALVAMLVVVSVSQKSLVLGLLATGISAMPMLAIEAVLLIGDVGMSMSIAFALVVAFGIAVDDAIHLLNRWRLADGDTQDRLISALEHAGPPMIASTMIMSMGFLATLFSATASLPIFGLYVIFSLCLALIVDLGLLPSLIKVVKR